VNPVVLVRLGIVGLRMYAASAGGTLPPVDQDPDDVRDDACQLLEPDTGVCSAPPKPTPTTVPRPDDGGGQGVGGSIDLGALLLWVLLVAAVVGIAYVIVRLLADRKGWSFSRRQRRDDDTDTDEIEPGAVVAVDRSREPTNWRDEADAHRRAGRYRDALRCRYRALVGDLARRGLIDEIPGRTTGEERAQLREVTPQASRPFDAAADLFDEAWYGHVDVADGDVDRFQRLEAEVLAGAVRR
jgi:hypothetical protein